jgi:hypothetical protein
VTSAYRLHRDAALRTGRRRPPRPGPVQAITVNRAVWREVLRLAAGDARRIQVIDGQTVVVHNRRRPA